MHKLTKRQDQILTLIRREIEKTGLPPTRAEICDYFGFASPNAAEQHLRALAAKGAIEMYAGASRGIRLMEAPEMRQLGLPVVGRVAAGSPVLAVENIERRVEIDPKVFKPRAQYLLTVKGQSMRDAGILDGDLIAVSAKAQAANGDIVVARLGDEVTVKRLSVSPAGRRVRLMPENPDFDPIEVRPDDDEFAIEGVMVGLLRWL